MKTKFIKIIALFLCFLLCFEQSGFAQVAGQLDISGYLAQMRQALTVDKFRPLHLRYLSYDNLNNTFKLLLDKGDFKQASLRGAAAGGDEAISTETKILLNYFFIGVSLPNDTFWVNLRPDSPENIIDPLLASTDVGKILLEADVQLKKDTAKFTSPDTSEGREYWDKLYQKAGEIFGSENITIPTLTRPWIVPDEIIIRESDSNAYIYKATLKVMLEEDYLSNTERNGVGARHAVPLQQYDFKDDRLKELNVYSSQLIRELIIPKLTKEINISKRYAPLRQVYYSLIMAQWFKQKFYGKGGKYSSLIDGRNLDGLTSRTPWDKDTYFQAYKESFEKGEYNIKEPAYTLYGQTIRSYFSGGCAITGESVAAAYATGGRIATADSGKGLSPELAKNGQLVDVDGGTTPANFVLRRASPSPPAVPAATAIVSDREGKIKEIKEMLTRRGFNDPQTFRDAIEAHELSADGFALAINAGVAPNELKPMCVIFAASFNLGKLALEKFKKGEGIRDIHDQFGRALSEISGGDLASIKFGRENAIFVPARLKTLNNSSFVEEGIKEGVIRTLPSLSLLAREILTSYGIDVNDPYIYLIPARKGASDNVMHNRSMAYKFGKGKQSRAFVFKGGGLADKRELNKGNGRLTLLFAKARPPYEFRGGVLEDEYMAYAGAAGWLREKFSEYYHSGDPIFEELKKEGLTEEAQDMFIQPGAAFQPLLLPAYAPAKLSGLSREEQRAYDSGLPMGLYAPGRFLDSAQLLTAAGFDKRIVDAQRIYFYQTGAAERIEELATVTNGDGWAILSYEKGKYYLWTQFFQRLNLDERNPAHRALLLKQMALRSLAVLRILWNEGYAANTVYGSIVNIANCNPLYIFDYDTIGKGTKEARAADIATFLQGLAITAYVWDLRSRRPDEFSARAYWTIPNETGAERLAVDILRRMNPEAFGAFLNNQEGNGGTFALPYDVIKGYIGHTPAPEDAARAAGLIGYPGVNAGTINIPTAPAEGADVPQILRRYTGAGDTSVHAALDDARGKIAEKEYASAIELLQELLADLRQAQKNRDTVPLTEKWDKRYDWDLPVDLLLQDIQAAMAEVQALLQQAQELAGDKVDLSAGPEVGGKVYDHDGNEGRIIKIKQAGTLPAGNDNIVIEFDRAPRQESVYRKDLDKFYRMARPEKKALRKKTAPQTDETDFFAILRIASVESELRQVLAVLDDPDDPLGLKQVKLKTVATSKGNLAEAREYLRLVVRAIDLGCLDEGVADGVIDEHIMAEPLSSLYKGFPKTPKPGPFLAALERVVKKLSMDGTSWPFDSDIDKLRPLVDGAQTRFDKVNKFYSEKLGYPLTGKFWHDGYFRMAANLQLYEAMQPYLEKMLAAMPPEAIKMMLDAHLDSPESTWAFCFFLVAVDTRNLYQDLARYHRVMGECVPLGSMDGFHETRLVDYGDNYVEILNDKVDCDGAEELAEYLTASRQILFQAAFASEKEIWSYLKVKHKELYSGHDRQYDGGRYLFVDEVPQDLAQRILTKEGKTRAALALSARGLSQESAVKITDAAGEFNRENAEANSKACLVFENLSSLLGSPNLTLNEITQALLVAAAEQGKNDAGQIYYILNTMIFQRMFNPQVLYGLVKALKGKTIAVVFKKFEEEFSLLEDLNADHQLERHLSFYAYVGARYGNAAGLIIGGIIDGTAKGIVPAKIDEAQQRAIIEFCDQMNSFSPLLYRAYQKSGDRAALAAELKAAADKVRTNTFGKKDINALFKLAQGTEEKEKYELLLAVYFTVIPPRDTSYLSWDDAVELVRKSVEDEEIGDPKKNLPPEIANYARVGVSVATARRKKKDPGIDNSSAIKGWMRRLESGDSAQEQVTEERLFTALLMYARGETGEAQLRVEFEAYLRQHAAFQEQLRAVLGEQDYYTQIQKFSTLLNDTLKHYLQPLQKRLSETVQPAATQKLSNKKGLLKQLAKAPPQALGKILGAIATAGLQELQEDLAGIGDAQRQVLAAEEIAKILSGRTDADASKARRVNILQAIWQENSALLEKELDNFVVESAGKSTLSFRVVKGYPFVIWGVNCGVCVAKDYDLWKDPFFYLLAIIDDETGLVEGFVHMYDYETSDGKRILLLPGINPTSELLSRTDPAEVLEEIIKTTHEIAQKAGFDVVYLPSNEFIYSNHHPIKRAIKAKNLKSFPMGEVIEWQKQHPVSEVFDVSAAATAERRYSASEIRQMRQDKTLDLRSMTGDPAIITDDTILVLTPGGEYIIRNGARMAVHKKDNYYWIEGGGMPEELIRSRKDRERQAQDAQKQASGPDVAGSARTTQPRVLLRYNENLTVFDRSAGSGAIAGISSEVIDIFTGENSSLSILSSAQILSLLANDQLEAVGIRARMDPEHGADPIVRIAQEGDSVVTELNYLELSNKLAGLTEQQAKVFIEVLLSWAAAAREALRLGLSSADASQAAMIAEASVFSSRSQGLSAPERDELKRRLWEKRQVYMPVQHDVSSLMVLMSRELGLSLNAEDVHRIGLDPLEVAGTMYLPPPIDFINIARKDIGKGDYYGEEIGHKLRTRAEERSSVQQNVAESKLSEQDRKSVDEFFGRIGRVLARVIAQENGLAGIFSQEDSTEWSNPQELLSALRNSHIDARMNNLVRIPERIMDELEVTFFRKMEEVMGRINRAREEIKGKPEAGNKLAQLLEKEAATWETYIDGIMKRYEDLLLFNLDILLQGLLFANNLVVCAEKIKLSRDSQQIQDSLNGLGDPAGSARTELSKKAALFNYTFSDKTESQLWHARGYAAAELFMKNNPDWRKKLPALIRMPSEQVFSEYVNTAEVNALIKKQSDDAQAGLAFGSNRLGDTNQTTYTAQQLRGVLASGKLDLRRGEFAKGPMSPGEIDDEAQLDLTPGKEYIILNGTHMEVHKIGNHYEIRGGGMPEELIRQRQERERQAQAAQVQASGPGAQHNAQQAATEIAQNRERELLAKLYQNNNAEAILKAWVAHRGGGDPLKEEEVKKWLDSIDITSAQYLYKSDQWNVSIVLYRGTLPDGNEVYFMARVERGITVSVAIRMDDIYRSGPLPLYAEYYQLPVGFSSLVGDALASRNVVIAAERMDMQRVVLKPWIMTAEDRVDFEQALNSRPLIKKFLFLMIERGINPNITEQFLILQQGGGGNHFRNTIYRGSMRSKDISPFIHEFIHAIYDQLTAAQQKEIDAYFHKEHPELLKLFETPLYKGAEANFATEGLAYYLQMALEVTKINKFPSFELVLKKQDLDFFAKLGLISEQMRNEIGEGLFPATAAPDVSASLQTRSGPGAAGENERQGPKNQGDLTRRRFLGVVAAGATALILPGASRARQKGDAPLPLEKVMEVDIGGAAEHMARINSSALERDSDNFIFKAVSEEGPDIYPVVYHGSAASRFYLSHLSGRLRKGSVLVHFDTHPDMEDGRIIKQEPGTAKEAAELDHDIDTFIPQLVSDDLFSEIWWVIPPSQYYYSPRSAQEWHRLFYSAIIELPDGTKFYYFRPTPPEEHPAFQERSGVKISKLKTVTVHRVQVDHLPDFKGETRDIGVSYDLDYVWGGEHPLATDASNEGVKEDKVIKAISATINESARALAQRNMHFKVLVPALSPGFLPDQYRELALQQLLRSFYERGLIGKPNLLVAFRRVKNREVILKTVEGEIKSFMPQPYDFDAGEDFGNVERAFQRALSIGKSDEKAQVPEAVSPFVQPGAVTGTPDNDMPTRGPGAAEENPEEIWKKNLRNELQRQNNKQEDIDKAIGLIEAGQRGEKGIILEIGCGDTEVALEIARNNPDLAVIGSDIFDLKTAWPRYREWADDFEKRLHMGQQRKLPNLVILRSASDILNILPGNALDYVLIANPDEGVVKKLFADQEILKSKVKMGVVIKPVHSFENLAAKEIGTTGLNFKNIGVTMWNVNLNDVSAFSEAENKNIWVGLWKKKSTPPQEDKNLGGIDFSGSMPIMTQPIPDRSPMRPAIQLSNSPALQPKVDPELVKKWQEIERLVKADIMPSPERLREYLQDCYANGCIDREIDKVLGCIADILRKEEERGCLTEASLKEILVALEQESSAANLAAALNKISVSPGEPAVLPQ